MMQAVYEQGASMQFLKNMSIANKLRAAFAIMLGLLALLAIFAYSRLQVVQGESHEISSNWLPAVRYAGAMDTDIAEYRISLLQQVAASDAAQAAVADKNMSDASAEFKKDSAAYAKLISSSEERQLFEKFSEAFARYQGLALRVVTMIKAG